jgi:branched-chain amino acid transport system substrate-binding protein
MREVTRRAWRIVALAGVGVLLLGACSSSSKSSSTSSTGGTSAGGGGATKTVKVGFFGALTGPNSPQLGINIADGVQLAIKEFNAKGGSVHVDYVAYDSQGDPSIAPSQAAKVVSDGTVAIVGPAFSGESKAVDPTFEQAGIVNITPSATNDTLQTHGYKFWHRVVANDDFQGPAEVKWLTKKLNAKNDYGKGLADTVRKGLSGAGVTVVNDAIDPKASDFSSTVNNMHSSNVDAIFYGGYYADLSRLMQQLRDGGVKVPIVSDDGAADNKLLEGPNATETNVYATCACKIATADPSAADFVNRYKAAFGADPGTYSTEGYDAANVILDAISHGNTTAKAINDYINTSGYSYKGVSKTISFSSNGDLPGGTIYIYQGQGGKLVLLGAVDQLVS